jgi:hypothetical protein
MVEQVTFQTIFQFLQTQRLAEESRQIQIMQSYLESEETFRQIIELLNMEWTDYEDFERKYGSDNNPDNYAIRASVWSNWTNLGYMLKNGLIERRMVFELAHVMPLVVWTKFEEIIKEIRRRYNQPFAWIYLEYLAEECVKYTQEKGFDATVPDTFFRYVPEQ